MVPKQERWFWLFFGVTNFKATPGVKTTSLTESSPLLSFF
jgi:hypothetical protein